MQSLVGDRLLKLFLKRKRRRVRHAGSGQVESKPESERALTGLPERTSDQSMNGAVQSQSEGGTQGLGGETKVPGELDSNNEFMAEDAAPVSGDDLDGGTA